MGIKFLFILGFREKAKEHRVEVKFLGECPDFPLHRLPHLFRDMRLDGTDQEIFRRMREIHEF